MENQKKIEKEFENIKDLLPENRQNLVKLFGEMCFGYGEQNGLTIARDAIKN